MKLKVQKKKKEKESAKDEMLEDDPNSEKNIIYQNIEKILALYSKLYHEKHSWNLIRLFTKK